MFDHDPFVWPPPLATSPGSNLNRSQAAPRSAFTVQDSMQMQWNAVLADHVGHVMRGQFQTILI